MRGILEKPLLGYTCAMKRTKQQTGRIGEQLAADFLTRQGFEIAGRNVRTSSGEIDLLARLGNLLVFVEVKTRTSTRFGFPEEAITPKKMAHMTACAEEYLQNHAECCQEWRLDVISILAENSRNDPQIEWFENVFS